MNIIIGLGNPGEKYKDTRHNVGYIALDSLAEELNLTWTKNKKFNAEVCQHGDIMFVKPLTFMNNSGQTAQSIMSYYNLLPKKLGFLKKKDCDLTESLTVIHDDVDIDLGKYKKASDSGSGGHNGIKSIINHLKTKKFLRIKVGIKTEQKDKMPTDKFVLQKFKPDERVIINNTIKDILGGIT